MNKNKITDYCPVCHLELIRNRRHDFSFSSDIFQCIRDRKHYRYEFDLQDISNFKELFWIEDEYEIINATSFCAVYHLGKKIYDKQDSIIPVFNKEELLNFLLLR